MKLNNLECTVETFDGKVNQVITLNEHQTTYGDGTVQCFIEVPENDNRFAIHVKSNKFIADGLSAYAFIDGKYQSNRLQLERRAGPSKWRAVDFLLDGKETVKKEASSDCYLGHADLWKKHWTFKGLDVGAADALPNQEEVEGTIIIRFRRADARPKGYAVNHTYVAVNEHLPNTYPMVDIQRSLTKDGKYQFTGMKVQVQNGSSSSSSSSSGCYCCSSGEHIKVIPQGDGPSDRDDRRSRPFQRNGPHHQSPHVEYHYPPHPYGMPHGYPPVSSGYGYPLPRGDPETYEAQRTASFDQEPVRRVSPTMPGGWNFATGAMGEDLDDPLDLGSPAQDSDSTNADDEDTEIDPLDLQDSSLRLAKKEQAWGSTVAARGTSPDDPWHGRETFVPLPLNLRDGIGYKSDSSKRNWRIHEWATNAANPEPVHDANSGGNNVDDKHAEQSAKGKGNNKANRRGARTKQVHFVDESAQASENNNSGQSTEQNNLGNENGWRNSNNKNSWDNWSNSTFTVNTERDTTNVNQESSGDNNDWNAPSNSNSGDDWNNQNTTDNSAWDNSGNNENNNENNNETSGNDTSWDNSNTNDNNNDTSGNGNGGGAPGNEDPWSNWNNQNSTDDTNWGTAADTSSFNANEEDKANGDQDQGNASWGNNGLNDDSNNTSAATEYSSVNKESLSEKPKGDGKPYWKNVPGNQAEDDEVRTKIEETLGVDWSSPAVKPTFTDKDDEPYAVFIFKYRSKSTIESIVGGDIVDYSQLVRSHLPELSEDELSGMSKEELVTLVRSHKERLKQAEANEKAQTEAQKRKGMITIRRGDTSQGEPKYVVSGPIHEATSHLSEEMKKEFRAMMVTPKRSSQRRK